MIGGMRERTEEAWEKCPNCGRIVKPVKQASELIEGWHQYRKVSPVALDSSPLVRLEQDSRPATSTHIGIVLLIQPITRTLSPCTPSARMVSSPDRSRAYFFINDRPPICRTISDPVVPRSIQQLHRQMLHQELAKHALPDQQITVCLGAYEVSSILGNCGLCFWDRRLA